MKNEKRSCPSISSAYSSSEGQQFADRHNYHRRNAGASDMRKIVSTLIMPIRFILSIWFINILLKQLAYKLKTYISAVLQILINIKHLLVSCCPTHTGRYTNEYICYIMQTLKVIYKFMVWLWLWIEVLHIFFISFLIHTCENLPILNSIFLCWMIRV